MKTKKQRGLSLNYANKELNEQTIPWEVVVVAHEHLQHRSSCCLCVAFQTGTQYRFFAVKTFDMNNESRLHKQYQQMSNIPKLVECGLMPHKHFHKACRQ